jgi:hypothetical protein
VRSDSKASSAGSVSGNTSVRHLWALLGLISAFALVFTVALSGQASASQVYKFKEAFGSAANPTFAQATGLAIDQSSDDLLIMDKGNGTISRFKPDGTPDNFSALGTNVIDGAGGEDKTPQEGLSFSSPSEAQIAIDNSGTITDGDIYVTAEPNVIDIFAGSGAYLGQLTGLSEACGVAVDPGGDVYVGDYNAGLKKFSPTANPPVNADFVATFPEPSHPCTLAAGSGPTSGSLFPASFNSSLYKQDAATGQIDYTAFPGPVITMTVAPGGGHVFAAHGQEVQELDASGASATSLARVKAQGPVTGVAVDSSGNVYISRSGSSEIEVFATTVNLPAVTATDATNVTGTKATLNGTVNPEGEAITECFFEYGPTTSYGQKTSSCTVPTDSATHPVSAQATGLASDGATVHYRLVAGNANGSEVSEDHTLVTAGTMVVEPATSVGAGTATLNGTVRPEGTPYTACKFEYGLNTSIGFEKEASCNPSAADIAPDFAAHAVNAAVTGLQGSATYKFRLTVTNANGTLTSEELTFSTFGPPLVTEVRALNASQGAATIEGRINPNGFATTYRFEWGPTASYGNQVPAELEPFVGEGSKAIRVSAKLPGLSAETTYHYRLVASSSAGTVTSPDQVLETLNSCGLPEERCFELVSRKEAGPVAIPGLYAAGAEMHYQAATEGDRVAYTVEAGYPEATKGAEVLYRGTRGPDGWDSTQLSTPILELNEQAAEESGTGAVQWLSHDLSCGFAESVQPLTSDPAIRLAREYGGSNLFRINPDGSYTAVSNLAPENPEVAGPVENYKVANASQDCSKVLFSSGYHYPGLAPFGLYEWDEGTLRNAGIVPGPSGEVAAGAVAGSGQSVVGFENTQNTVSEDGSRVFFSAARQASPNPEEIGTEGIFVREDGSTSRDLSLSETSVPDKGATYQWATPDGSKVFFTANAGLTDESSSEGPDLYMYDLESEKLTDLTPYGGEGGAQVEAIIGAAEDGSRVYFASRNQLVPGKGKTLAGNQSANTVSIYGESNGQFDFVGTFRDSEFIRVALRQQRLWTSRVSPDGRYLLFETSAKVTAYDSGGAIEAYLYDSQGGSEGTTCVSCRQDGQPSIAPQDYAVLPYGEGYKNFIHGPQFLTIHEGEPQVFFSSPDKLAPGAVENQNNVYEWSHGQVFRLVSAQKGQESPEPRPGHYAVFVGAGVDGSDTYLVTPETLTWEDGDERLSVYDARVGGGFAAPPAPPAPCEATSEGSGSCQGPAQGAPALSGAASAAFNGPGNPPGQSTKKKSKKKAHKKKRKSVKKKGNGKQARHANSNRRAGK